MTEEHLLAIMAAIVFAGADNNEGCAGYTTYRAAEIAMDILSAVNAQVSAMSKEEKQ